MINRLWKWMDRHLDPPTPCNEPNIPLSMWAEQQWAEFEQRGTAAWHIKDDIYGCPACHATRAVEVSRFLAGATTERGRRLHGKWFNEARAQQAALGPCRCELRLSEQTAHQWAIAEIAPHLART